MTAPDPAAVAAERQRLIAALDGPEPEGNPVLFAATEAILRDRMVRFHYAAEDEQRARAAFAIDALADASAAIDAARPLISKEAAAAERASIRKLAVDLGATVPADPDNPDALTSFADHIDFTGPGVTVEEMVSGAARYREAYQRGVVAERERLLAELDTQFTRPRGSDGSFASGWRTAISEFRAIVTDPAHKLAPLAEMVQRMRAGRLPETFGEAWDDGVAAERKRWLTALADPRFCLLPCDADCESGPVHCEWIHQPNHKHGWHDPDACPFASLTGGE